MHINFPRFIRCVLMILLWSGSAADVFADVHDHIRARAYWEDVTGNATIKEAQTHTFTPYDGVLSRGYTGAAIWIQLEISPLPHIKADEKLVLRIRPTYLDELTLFDPLDTSGLIRKTGDQVSYKHEEYKSLAHTFVIPAGAGPRDVWIRLKATSTTFMQIEALSIEDMQIDEHRLLTTSYLVLALIMVFSLVVLMNWINYREFLYAAFVVRNFIFFVYAAAFFGLARFFLSDWLSATTLDATYNWLVVGTTAFAFWFETRFLNEYAPPRWAQMIFYCMYGWSLAAMLLLVLGHTREALQTNMLLNGVGILVLLVVSVTFVDGGQRVRTRQAASLLKKKFVVGYYLVLTSLIMFSVLPYLGLLVGSEFGANGLVYYALISGLDMTILLQLRSNQLRQARIQLDRELLLSNQQVEFEKVRRDEQSQMLTMLMHELKNPLAVIDLAQHTSEDAHTRDYVSRNVSIIRDVLDQCVIAERLSEGKVTIQKAPVDLVALINDLTKQPQHIDRFIIQLPDAIPTLHTDYQCLRIALNNLIDNALRYGDIYQPIEIAVTIQANVHGDAGVLISIANHPGVAGWPDADKVFQKYYRSSGAKSISGTGLGLSLVRSLSNLLGAKCIFAPDITRVRFKLWLPS